MHRPIGRYRRAKHGKSTTSLKLVANTQLQCTTTTSNPNPNSRH